ncbi:MAG: Formamidopyrimidine-DNA glycosylase [Pelotomaculum sp. PtaB.Bin104]|nr:MAG: Formamidopyrimidine-DNA glycosylase [Pelotomaculum sp. PtaB.Bin104]
MIELPEAYTLARQIKNTIVGKKISNAIAAFSPHKFAWFHGDPEKYPDLLAGKTIGGVYGYGGLVEVKAGSAALVFGDGVGLRYHRPNESRPKKHQLLIEFDDHSAMSAAVQMYGGLYCFQHGDFDNPYYSVARNKPSPLSVGFSAAHFNELISKPEVQKLSAKAFLATEQRIPGLGNGVLQDILWNARIHPKRKINTLTDESKAVLFNSIKTILVKMVESGGRDTEKDLFGNKGGYKTIMSKNNIKNPCPICGGLIKRESYMGGSVYYCQDCQML